MTKVNQWKKWRWGKTLRIMDRLQRSNREWDEHISQFVPAKKLRSILRNLEFGYSCQESCDCHLSKVEAHLAIGK